MASTEARLTILLYLHPILGVAAILYALHLANLAAAGRSIGRRNELRIHARRAPLGWALMLAAWAGGIATVALLRTDLRIGASRHFAAGTAIVVLVSASFASSRWIDRPAVRAIHPWLGATALVLSGVHAVLGFELLP